jgi:hypothetical protein
MSDIKTVIASGEHYEVEAKKAESSLPESLWEKH